jgi:hypothetical protein
VLSRLIDTGLVASATPKGAVSLRFTTLSAEGNVSAAVSGAAMKVSQLEAQKTSGDLAGRPKHSFSLT